MVLPHPIHKRVLCRIGFYGAVICYLWVFQMIEHRGQQQDSRGSITASVIQ
jgi:hypothetical protein